MTAVPLTSHPGLSANGRPETMKMRGAIPILEKEGQGWLIHHSQPLLNEEGVVFKAVAHAARGTQEPRKCARSALECDSEAAALKSRRKGGG